MKLVTIVLLVAFLSCIVGPEATATVVLDIEVVVDKATYTIGESVSWTISATTTSAAVDPANNGIAGLELDLADNTVDALSPGVIDALWGAAGYGVTSGGMVVGSDLQSIQVVNLMSPGTALGADGAQRTVATGNYMVSTVGAHALTLAANPMDQAYYNSMGQALSFDSIGIVNADFTVVPEPASWMLLGFSAGLFLCARGWIRAAHHHRRLRCQVRFS